jgi:hypothetical protein
MHTDYNRRVPLWGGDVDRIRGYGGFCRHLCNPLKDMRYPFKNVKKIKKFVRGR